MSLFDRMASLPLAIEGYSHEPHEQVNPGGFRRLTTVIRLEGGGSVGRGEDVSYSKRDQERLRTAGPTLALTGEFTLASFSKYLDSLELWPDQPEHAMNVDYRRWGYESAALELAVAQAKRPLAELLGRDQRAARFVVSTVLGTPPSTRRLLELLEFEPRLRFKLDADKGWDARLIAELAELGRVEVVDFKGAYAGTSVDQVLDTELYRRVLSGLPDVWLEDPHREPAAFELLEGFWERVTWDAPIHSVDDVRALEHEPRMLNIKPSRCGTLAKYFDLVDYCESHEIAMYAGGQFELADGRRLIQRLAGIFHPDAPNDIAPVEFNRVELNRPVDDGNLSYPGA